MTRPSTVFIVDDDRDFARSLGWVVEAAGFAVETYGSAQEFQKAFDGSRRGCLVLDVRLRGMSGLELLDQFAREGIRLPIIMMTGFGDFSTAVRALKGGAVDIVQKPVDHEALLARIREALTTEEKAQLSRVESVTAMERLKQLTPRERVVLDLVVTGKSSKEIANDLELGVRTVETHRAHAMEKLGAHSSADVVRMVLLARMAS